ncbi:NUDIX domain-containing protein [Halomarina litorea]|uniref:NUDIX domain-containing protein n=1 Tax=Halomarina litorea TaxID=2961595 RepID=UPI0020C39739|nr:NUDIX domain-containing protein [Halomarina sp. BCD28]
MTDPEGTPVVTCFLRNGTDVLLLRRSDAVGSYPGRWGGVAGHVEPGDGEDGVAGREPADAARAEIRQETGLGDRVSLVRVGDPFPAHDDDHGTWVVHPFLFECDSRAVETNRETSEFEWAPPTAMLDRETVPDLWRSYEAVAPTVETVREDRDHGAAYLSVRALEVLRDRAARDAHEGDAEWDSLAELARDLREARPSMTVVVTRIDRAMHAADGDPSAVRNRAEEVIEDALAADEAAADRAVEELAGAERVLTLSRSGTVAETLDRLAPDRVFVAESRPGGEGRGVAESLADSTAVTLLTDSTVAHALATEPIDAVLVGADTVLPDGRVVNKVGTRGAALAAAHEGVPTVVVTARDKIRPEGESGDPDLEPRPASEVYDGDASLEVLAPTFDVTPGEVVSLVTEVGVLDAAGVARVARDARERAGWVAGTGNQ